MRDSDRHRVVIGAVPVDVETVFKDSAFSKVPGPAAAGSPAPATRLSNALTIVRTALGEGLPLGVALAMVVNANAESGLNHLAVGDGGHAIGLFQANDLGGKRTFPGDRRDPVSATKWIISEYRAAYDKTVGKDLSKSGAMISRPSLRSAVEGGKSVADVAGLFAFHVERPWDLQGEEARRRAKTYEMFPSWVASAPANGLFASKVVQAAKSVPTPQEVAPYAPYAAGAGIASLALGGVLLVALLAAASRLSK